MARMKLPSNMVAAGLEPGSRGYELRTLTPELQSQAFYVRKDNSTNAMKSTSYKNIKVNKLRIDL